MGENAKRLFFVYNPHSGRGNIRSKLFDIVQVFSEAGYEITIYPTCCNTSKGIYYYTTYENPQITAVNMHATDLNGTEVVSYPMLQDTEIRYQN